MLVGGRRPPAGAAVGAGPVMINQYGPTETTMWVAMSARPRPEAGVIPIPARRCRGRPCSCWTAGCVRCRPRSASCMSRVVQSEWAIGGAFEPECLPDSWRVHFGVPGSRMYHPGIWWPGGADGRWSMWAASMSRSRSAAVSNSVEIQPRWQGGRVASAAVIARGTDRATSDWSATSPKATVEQSIRGDCGPKWRSGPHISSRGDRGVRYCSRLVNGN